MYIYRISNGFSVSATTSYIALQQHTLFCCNEFSEEGRKTYDNATISI